MIPANQLVNELQPQPLDVFTSEVDTQRENLTHLRRGQPPRQGARVRPPVIQDLSYLQHKYTHMSKPGNSVHTFT